MTAVLIFAGLCLVAYLISYSNRDKSNDPPLPIKPSRQEPTMLSKYKVLIDYILQIDKGYTIVRLVESSLNIRLPLGGKYNNEFYLKEENNILIVLWASNTAEFGIHLLDWKFSKNENQETIFQEILYSLKKKSREMMEIQNTPVSVKTIMIDPQRQLTYNLPLTYPTHDIESFKKLVMIISETHLKQSLSLFDKINEVEVLESLFINVRGRVSSSLTLAFKECTIGSKSVIFNQMEIQKDILKGITDLKNRRASTINISKQIYNK